MVNSIMPNDVVILADAHLHQAPLWRFNWNQVFLDKLLKEYSYKYDIILLGDVFESRDRLDSTVSNQFVNFTLQWAARNHVYWLTGQHDSYLPGKATLGGLATANDNITVIDDSVVKYPGYPDRFFVPFARKDKDYRTFLSQVPDESIVFTHIPTVEAISMFGVADKQGISVKEFTRFKKTYSGDIHKYYDFPELTYIGAPSQRDWRDRNTIGVYGILTRDNEFCRVKTDHPIHIDLTKEQQDIPSNRKCIVKTFRGDTVTGDNIIQSLETTDIDIESINLAVELAGDAIITQYLCNNPVPDKFEQSDFNKFAQDILNEVEIENG